ncbi:hypothetical protein TNCV_3519161 [Trichonephila clavipes]|uniref:Uncharacterized protein n=1 Tax=Trichonephila clavipes TaxID=2585209 RepID=A0A8X6SQ56_TRICX|nr:hypothetical protein TNCV_3519161 [Trichonephila clavipes]
MLQDYDTSFCRVYFSRPRLFSSPSLFSPVPTFFSSVVARSFPLSRLSFDLLPGAGSCSLQVQYFVRGGFVGHRSRASSKHLSPHLPVDELDSSGVKKGLHCSCKMHVWVWVSGPQRSRLDVDVSEK